MKTKQKVLISGASIAGPALAYWLDRFGFEVTVVERAAEVRGGGYPIDIRGAALDVVDRMGILADLTRAHIDTRRVRFYKEGGSLIATIRPEAITGGVEGRDIEVPRGALATAILKVMPPTVDFIFEDSIASLGDDGQEVHVTFTSGRRDTFDLVVGADGLHSSTRAMVFGPEEPFANYLGFCFAGFSMPNTLGLSHEGISCSLPGKSMTMICPGDSDTLHGFFSFARESSPFEEFRDRDSRRQLVADTFRDVGWHARRMVSAMSDADDLFFDVVSQITMPTWSKGRIALIGDAAHATSFFSGQGSSVSLVGAYILAGELAARADHEEAFRRYETLQRPFAVVNQALAGDGQKMTVPRSRRELLTRNALLRMMPLLVKTGIAAKSGREANTDIDLPDYDALVAS